MRQKEITIIKTFVVTSMWCKQPMWCNLCGDVYVMQSMWCNVCGAIYVVQPMGCMQPIWCNLCGANTLQTLLGERCGWGSGRGTITPTTRRHSEEEAESSRGDERCPRQSQTRSSVVHSQDTLDTLKTLWALSRRVNGEEEEDYVILVDRAAPDRSSNAGQLSARLAPEHLVISLVSQST